MSCVTVLVAAVTVAVTPMTLVDVVKMVLVLVPAGNLVLQKFVAGGYAVRGAMSPCRPCVHFGSFAACTKQASNEATRMEKVRILNDYCPLDRSMPPKRPESKLDIYIRLVRCQSIPYQAVPTPPPSLVFFSLKPPLCLDSTRLLPFLERYHL